MNTTKDYQELYGKGWLQVWKKKQTKDRKINEKSLKKDILQEKKEQGQIKREIHKKILCEKKSQRLIKKEIHKNALQERRVYRANEKKRYMNKVRELTEMIVHKVDGFDKRERGFKNFHIDHKISLNYGWRHDIPYEHIADISNLRFIPFEENIKKGTGIYIDHFNEWILKTLY